MAGNRGEAKPRNTKLGAPTTYKPEYCDLVEKLASQGYSKAEIAAELTRGSYDQLDDWQKAAPAFRDAMLRARTLSLAYWERLARKEAGNRDFNSNLYRIAMLGRFSAEYREAKVVVEQTPVVGADLSQLSAAEREALAELLSKAKIAQSPVPTVLPQDAQLEPGKPQSAGNGHSTH
jgi:hypothetical protein